MPRQKKDADEFVYINGQSFQYISFFSGDSSVVMIEDYRDMPRRLFDTAPTMFIVRIHQAEIPAVLRLFLEEQKAKKSDPASCLFFDPFQQTLYDTVGGVDATTRQVSKEFGEWLECVLVVRHQLIHQNNTVKIHHRIKILNKYQSVEVQTKNALRIDCQERENKNKRDVERERVETKLQSQQDSTICGSSLLITPSAVASGRRLGSAFVKNRTVPLPVKINSTRLGMGHTLQIAATVLSSAKRVRNETFGRKKKKTRILYRRIAFRIHNPAEDDYKIVRQCVQEQNSCGFCLSVLARDGTIFGLVITTPSKSAKTFSQWRKIASAKSADNASDFTKDTTFDASQMTDYGDICQYYANVSASGELHQQGSYTSRGRNKTPSMYIKGLVMATTPTSPTSRSLLSTNPLPITNGAASERVRGMNLQGHLEPRAQKDEGGDNSMENGNSLVTPQKNTRWSTPIGWIELQVSSEHEPLCPQPPPLNAKNTTLYSATRHTMLESTFPLQPTHAAHPEHQICPPGTASTQNKIDDTESDSE